MHKFTKILQLAELFYKKALTALAAKPSRESYFPLEDIEPGSILEDIEPGSILDNIEVGKTPMKAYYMPDDPEDDLSEGEIETISQQSANFEIKGNDRLKKQFDDFMETYEEFIDLIDANNHKLTEELVEVAPQLANTLQYKFERLISNPYLDIGKDYIEDFNPGDFTQFIQNVYKDAADKKDAIFEESGMSPEEISQAPYFKRNWNWN